jgi:cob(I)alamin adenosyltransferase
MYIFNGETTDLSGNKMSKNNVAVHLVGAIDELNSHLGLIKAMLSHDETWQFTWQYACKFIERTQRNLMKLMSHVSDCVNEKYWFCETEVIELDKEISRLQRNLPKNYKFVLPGANVLEAQIQIGRTVARRTERLFAAANEEYKLCAKAGAYINKLSDYLYFLSQQESLINVNFLNQFTGF